MAAGGDGSEGCHESDGFTWRSMVKKIIAMIFVRAPSTYPTLYDPNGPDDSFRTINYHHLDISGHDGMDEQNIGWRNGWF
jgi:hypothetical protein